MYASKQQQQQKWEEKRKTSQANRVEEKKILKV